MSGVEPGAEHVPALDDRTVPWRALPGPNGPPWIGSALSIEPGRLHAQLEDWARAYGPCYRVRLGPSRWLVLSDHRAIAAVLKERPGTFSRVSRMRRAGIELGLKEGVFSANGDRWRAQRALVTRAFTPANVRRWAPDVLRVVERLERRWADAASADRSIDLQADLMRYTVDVVAGLAFGAEVNTLEGGEDVLQRDLDRIFPALFGRAASPLPIRRWWPGGRDPELTRAIARVNRGIDGFVAAGRQRLADEAERRDAPPNLLEAMLVASAADGSTIDEEAVAGNVMTMLLAGEDTTANTLAWTLYLLSREPDALRRAREEVLSVVGERTPLTLDALERLPFLDACAHESLRLKPVAPMLPVEAIHDTTVAGVRIGAGTVVMNLMRVDATDPAWVPDADRYRPARWLEEASSSRCARPGRVSMPFGAGPRLCPGRWLALLEIRAALAMLLRRFDVVSVGTADGDPPSERLAFTMAPVGLELRLRERALARDAPRTGSPR